MITIHPKAETKIREENAFELFKHNGLICCVQRMGHSGNLNGYVAITKDHPLFGKLYSDKIKVNEEPKFNGNYIGLLCAAFDDKKEENVYSIDMALNVHGGITFSRAELAGVDKELFGELWWFGFDTAHAGDLRPFQTDIDRKYPLTDEEYRDFEYVKDETKQLAEQLIKIGEGVLAAGCCATLPITVRACGSA